MTKSAVRLVAVLAAFAAVAVARPAAAQIPARPDTVDRVVAVVGAEPILESEVVTAIQQKRQADSTLVLPTDSAGWAQFQLAIINGIIDEKLLLQKAADEKLTIPDSVLAPAVDAQISQTRSAFPTEAMYRSELAKAGMGTPDEYRQYLMQEYRDLQLQQQVVAKLQRDGKILPVVVSEAEVQQAFDAIHGNIGRRPATFTWRQIVIDPKPSPQEKEAALRHIDSLRTAIVNGADFARIAKRESADSTSRELGGDIGWNRRGGGLTPNFERVLFAMDPGKVSPVFETPFGFHILRVDRVNGPERRARHILVRWAIDSADLARTRALADSVKAMWQAGTPYDTLAARYHDFASREESAVLTPFPFDSLPQPYQDAFAGRHDGDIVVFKIPNKGYPGISKFVVARIDSYQPGGPLTLADVRNQLRRNLEQTAAIRHYLDGLRKTTFVEIRPDALAPPSFARGAGS
ncbi:MAG TPA: peptidylprolyl isomerase [Gemmatimonadaceae bacterium]|nr:peptidylprolyl isomerase [Gemmatimonadaceae bacterium]